MANYKITESGTGNMTFGEARVGEFFKRLDDGTIGMKIGKEGFFNFEEGLADTIILQRTPITLLRAYFNIHNLYIENEYKLGGDNMLSNYEKHTGYKFYERIIDVESGDFFIYQNRTDNNLCIKTGGGYFDLVRRKYFSLEGKSKFKGHAIECTVEIRLETLISCSVPSLEKDKTN